MGASDRTILVLLLLLPTAIVVWSLKGTHCSTVDRRRRAGMMRKLHFWFYGLLSNGRCALCVVFMKRFCLDSLLESLCASRPAAELCLARLTTSVWLDGLLNGYRPAPLALTPMEEQLLHHNLHVRQQWFCEAAPPLLNFGNPGRLSMCR